MNLVAIQPKTGIFSNRVIKISIIINREMSSFQRMWYVFAIPCSLKHIVRKEPIVGNVVVVKKTAVNLI